MLLKEHGDYRSVCLVVPTYNEAGNITRLLDLIYSSERRLQFMENGIDMGVLVVDDNSPDGTAKIVERYRKKNHMVHLLLRRNKNGLGAAYIAGMQHALSALSPDIIFEMDADLSHNPDYIIPMITEIRNGADFVIGSRYMKGGSIPSDWGFQRKIISRAANTYTRAVLGIRNVHDCTGGFRAIKSSFLEKIDLNSLNVRGYAFQISLLNAIMRNGGAISEVPIAFSDRTDGKSKMQLNDIVEVGIVVLRMAAQRFVPNGRDWQEEDIREIELEMERSEKDSTRV